MVEWKEIGIWCGIASLMIIFLGILTVVLPVQNDFIETRYEVGALDLQTLVYVNNNGEIITIHWSDKTSQIKIVSSDTTYIITETNEHFTFHTLYLNVSDLE